MWNVDGYSDALKQLVAQVNDGIDLITPISPTARLNTAWEIALVQAANLLQERLGSELAARFQAAEWEKPITLVLENLVRSNNLWVEMTGCLSPVRFCGKFRWIFEQGNGLA